MAAAKVFAIPELLENIFLQLADIVITDEIDKAAAERIEVGRWGSPERITVAVEIHPQPRALEPLRSLARCHLVSRSFDATLNGSTKLQQLMYGSCVLSLDGRSLPRMHGAFWLAQQLGGAAIIEECGHSSRISKIVKWGKPFAGDKRTRGHHAPEASWRRIRVFTSEGKSANPTRDTFYVRWNHRRKMRTTTTRRRIADFPVNLPLGELETWMEEHFSRFMEPEP